MTEQQRIERARLARQSLEFLDEAFSTVTTAYLDRLEALAASTPWESGKITALANAKRIAAEVRNQIALIVADGTEASSQVERAKKIEALTPAKRRFLQIGAH